MIEIELTNLQEFLDAIEPDTLIGPPMRKAHKQSVIALEGAAKGRTPLDTGRAKGSITHHLDSSPIPLWSSVGSPVKYIPPLEYGRKPGKMPPIDDLKLWARRKGIPSSAVYAIALKIKRKGTKGAHMFKRSFKDNEARIKRLFENALKEMQDRFGS